MFILWDYFVGNRGDFGGLYVNVIFIFWCWGGVGDVEAICGGCEFCKICVNTRHLIASCSCLEFEVRSLTIVLLWLGTSDISA